jgi:hypothetical protein
MNLTKLILDDNTVFEASIIPIHFAYPAILVVDTAQFILTNSYREATALQKTLHADGKRTLRVPSWRKLQEMYYAAEDNQDIETTEAIFKVLNSHCKRIV